MGSTYEMVEKTMAQVFGLVIQRFL